jgi:hypothetical protein
MLQKVGSFNDIPQSMLPPKLEKGETVTYQFVTGKPNPVPKSQRGNRDPDIIYNVLIRIPTSDTIRLSDGRIVNIGVVDSINKDGEVKTKFLSIRANDNGGFFSVVGGDIATEVFYYFLELTNRNESNENRDENVEPLFKRVDRKKEAKLLINRGEAIGTATNAVIAMNIGELRQLAAALNMHSENEPEILRGELMKMAIETPENFIKIIENPDIKIKSLIKRASELGLITYVPVEHKWMWSTGQTVARIDLVEGKDELEGMADWIKSHANGLEVENKLKSLVAKEVKGKKGQKGEAPKNPGSDEEGAGE